MSHQFSEKLSIDKQLRRPEEYSNVNFSKNMVEDDEVSMKDKDGKQQRQVLENEINENCPITQRINQYLTNIINDQDLEISQKEPKIQRKHLEKSQKQHKIQRKQENTRIASRTISPKCDEHFKNTKDRKPGKPRPRDFQKRHKYSPESYWEEFENFRKTLDSDDRKCNKSKEIRKEFENNEEDFHECKNITLDQPRNTNPKYCYHGNEAQDIPQQENLNISKEKIKNADEYLETKTKETSIWIYL